MRVIKLLLLSLIFFTSLGFASNFDTALELARAKMADKVIDRLNSIYEYANKYILQTRDTNITNQKLKQKYNLPSTAFKNNRGGDFNTTYEKNENISKIVFHNALPNASTLMRKIVKQSTVLSSKAKFDDSNLSDIKFVYILPLETQNFINNKDKKVLSTTNQSIIDDTIIVNSKDELSRLQKQPQTGTIAYVKKDNVLQTYIKTENGWAKETTTSTNKLNTASECNTNTLGAVNYSREKGCMLFCSYSNGNPKWACIGEKIVTNTNNTNTSPNTNTDTSSDDFEKGFDYSSVWNNYGGFYNSPVYPNYGAYAVLKNDGSIVAWGGNGGRGAPTDKGYVKIFPSNDDFAALKSDGSIVSWGKYGGKGAPTDKGYVSISSNFAAFAALNSDGSIKAWGDKNYGGSGAPTDKNFVKIFSTNSAFTALKKDGSIVSWGDSSCGGSGAPTEKGFIKIFSNLCAFAALKEDGSIVSWGRSAYGGNSAPTGTGFVRIFSTYDAFAALKKDGSIETWGAYGGGGHSNLKGNDFVRVFSNPYAFAAIKKDGSIVSWGHMYYGGKDAPTDKGYVKIFSDAFSFIALKKDGSIKIWGNKVGSAPQTNIKNIFSTYYSFTFLKKDGTIVAKGHPGLGGSGAPSTKDIKQINGTDVK